MNCFFCQIPVPEGTSTCAACGRELGKVCLSCNLLYETGANFCMACGGKLAVRTSIAPKKTVPPDGGTAGKGKKERPGETPFDRRHITLTEIVEPAEVGRMPLTVEGEDDLAIEVTLQDNGKAPRDEPEGSALEAAEPEEEIVVQTSEVRRPSGEEELTPYLPGTSYAVSLQEMSDAVTARIADPAVPSLFEAAGRMLAESRGGFLTFEAPPGAGKSHFAAVVEDYANKNPLADVLTTVSTVNPFDFDYTMFIHLIRAVLNIRSDDAQQVRAKIDKYLGGFLPEGKRESLTALLCLNFAPVQVKLPKSDIDYLFAALFYWAARNKPVLWVVDNAGQINVRSLRFLKNLQKVFRFIPFVVVFLCDSDAPVAGLAGEKGRFRFSGVPHAVRMEAVRNMLKTSRLPADIEKVLNKPDRNMLYSQELLRFLMDHGFIFEMRGEWRFQKLPEDLEIPEETETLVLLRYALLDQPLALMLRRLVMLNLYQIPKDLAQLLFPNDASLFDALVAKHYLTADEEGYRFASRAIVNILRRNFKIEPDDRRFYREVSQKLFSATGVSGVNRHWLLLSYLNLAGISDRAYNSFLYTSAIYMEKVGFFELAQRCYQSILSSFGKNQEHRDFRLYLELKNAKLWGFSDPQWARLFWQTMHDTAVNEGLLHIQLVSRGELILLEPERIVVQEVVDVVQDLHKAGCYDDEISIIDRVSDVLLSTGNFSEAKIFANRAHHIMEDIRARGGQETDGVGPAVVVYIRSSCKLAEVHIALREYAEAVAVLQPALEIAVSRNASYFKAKIYLLLGKARRSLGEEWEPLVREGFQEAVRGMDFPVMKMYFRFFEEQQSETAEWLAPYLEYKNWMNF